MSDDNLDPYFVTPQSQHARPSRTEHIPSQENNSSQQQVQTVDAQDDVHPALDELKNLPSYENEVFEIPEKGMTYHQQLGAGVGAGLGASSNLIKLGINAGKNFASDLAYQGLKRALNENAIGIAGNSANTIEEAVRNAQAEGREIPDLDAIKSKNLGTNAGALGANVKTVHRIPEGMTATGGQTTFGTGKSLGLTDIEAARATAPTKEPGGAWDLARQRAEALHKIEQIAPNVYGETPSGIMVPNERPPAYTPPPPKEPLSPLGALAEKAKSEASILGENIKSKIPNFSQKIAENPFLSGLSRYTPTIVKDVLSGALHGYNLVDQSDKAFDENKSGLSRLGHAASGIASGVDLATKFIPKAGLAVDKFANPAAIYSGQIADAIDEYNKGNPRGVFYSLAAAPLLSNMATLPIGAGVAYLKDKPESEKRIRAKVSSYAHPTMQKIENVISDTQRNMEQAVPIVGNVSMEMLKARSALKNKLRNVLGSEYIQD